MTMPDVPVFSRPLPRLCRRLRPQRGRGRLCVWAPQHLLRSEVSPSGAFQTFGSLGQNASGANQYIHAAYTSFNPSWRTDTPIRMRPWSGASTDPAQIRFALRAQESVTEALLEEPSSQQLQQVLRMLVINEGCTPETSSSFCQIEFNFKTYNRGVGAYTSFTEATCSTTQGRAV